MERLGHGDGGHVADGSERFAVTLNSPIIEEHSNRLDGIQGNALRPRHDLVDGGLRQAGHEAGQQLAHRLIRQRPKAKGGERPLSGAPVRSPVDQLWAGERNDVDRAAARPGQHLLDEVEQTRVGPLQVLEDHRYRPGLRDALEEGSP